MSELAWEWEGMAPPLLPSSLRRSCLHGVPVLDIVRIALLFHLVYVFLPLLPPPFFEIIYRYMSCSRIIVTQPIVFVKALVPG